MQHHTRPYWFILIPLLISLAFNQFGGYPLEKSLSLSILTTSILMWVSEAIPAPITALLIPCLGIIYGVISPKEAFSPFASDITFLFIGAFLLALGLEKHGLDKRIAFSLLKIGKVFPSLRFLICILGLTAFFLSMWMSNTATVAILCPITLGVINILEKVLPTEKQSSHFNEAALLCICYSATFGGIATPIGTPANLLTIGFLEDHGLPISFLEWMSWGVPISIFCFILLTLFLLIRFKIVDPPAQIFQEIYLTIDQERQKLGSMSRAEIQVATVFILTVALWISPDLLASHPTTKALGGWMIQHLPTANVALLGGILLFILPTALPHSRNLIQEEINQIDWGTIFLFGGGLSLSAILVSTGVARDLGTLLSSLTTTGSLGTLILLSSVALILSEIISNTASAAILLSIAFSSVGASVGFSSPDLVSEQADLIASVVAVGISCSLGFMMPIASPPNAMVYGTGLIPLGKMLTTGLAVNLIGISVVILFIKLVF